MNGKTARLIRKYVECLQYHQPYTRILSREWKAMSGSERFAQRQHMKHVVSQAID